MHTAMEMLGLFVIGNRLHLYSLHHILFLAKFQVAFGGAEGMRCRILDALEIEHVSSQQQHFPTTAAFVETFRILKIV